MKIAEKCKRKQEQLLIEGYKEMAEESLKINKEFEAIEEDLKIPLEKVKEELDNLQDLDVITAQEQKIYLTK